MDVIGFGTGRLSPDVAYDSIATALSTGYRFFDTARNYGTESVLAAAMADSGVSRSEVTIGTKIDSRKLSPSDVVVEIEQSLTALETDFVDILYGHWPAHAFDPERTLAAFAELREQGKVRSIGMCNVTPALLSDIASQSRAALEFVQVEFHPWLYQAEIIEIAEERELTVVAESPLAAGELFSHAVVGEVARNHGCTLAQVLLAWCLHHGTIPVPRSSSDAHIRENFRASEVTLEADEVRRLDSLDGGRRVNDYEFAPWNS